MSAFSALKVSYCPKPKLSYFCTNINNTGDEQPQSGCLDGGRLRLEDWGWRMKMLNLVSREKRHSSSK